MKIAVLNATIFPIPAVRGGAVESLIESFVSQANTDPSVELTVFSLDDEQARTRAAHFPRVRFEWLARPAAVDAVDRGITRVARWIKRDPDMWQKNLLWQRLVVRRLQRALEQEDFDAVIIENAIFLCSLFDAPSLREKYRGKVFFHSHNVHFRTVTPSPAFAGILSISAFLIDNCRQCFGPDLPIRVVPNGVPTERFDREISEAEAAAEKAALRERYGIPPEAALVVFAGRIMPKKGVAELLDVAELLGKQGGVDGRPVHVMLVGASSFGDRALTGFEAEVARRVEANPLLHATGFIPNAQLGAYYAAADVVALLSTWEEPFGLTIIEAQLAGRPLITTNMGGIPEAAHADLSQLLGVGPHLARDLADAIATVLRDPAIWEARAKQARERARELFSEERYYRQMISSIRDGLPGGAGL